MNICKVCELLDNDSTPKATAEWCGVCGTFICGQCRWSPTRRVMAAVAHRMLRHKKAPKRT
jgi:hypothetical protein